MLDSYILMHGGRTSTHNAKRTVTMCGVKDLTEYGYGSKNPIETDYFYLKG